MIYTACYHWRNHHHGLKISISQTIPEGFKVDGSLSFFKPSAYLLNAFKKKTINQDGYIDRFREEIRQNLPHIKLWMTTIKPEEDMTLLCHEPPGQFCHRNLILKLVEKYRPDCLGGADMAERITPKNSVKQDWLQPPKSNNARERIDFFLNKQRTNNWKTGAVTKAVFYDHQKGYITLTYEDLKYMGEQLYYKPYWAIKQAELLNIPVVHGVKV